LISVAENGVALIETLNGLRDETAMPHFIILDQNMPKRNGLQTLELLKKHPRYSQIPVVIYSTYIEERLKQEGKNLGACDVLAKPVTQEGYNQMITTIIKHCRA
jgi:CheY-like chemotaxis protein